MSSVLVAPESRIRAGISPLPFIAPRIERAREATISEFCRLASPDPRLSDEHNDYRRDHFQDYLEQNEDVHWLLRGIEQGRKVSALIGTWYANLLDVDGSIIMGGLQSHHILTDVGAQRIRAAFDSSDVTSIANAKFHGIGTSNTTPAATQTALLAELTTEYLVANTRATGSQGQGATSKVYASDAVNPIGTTPGASIKEAGIFDVAARGSGHMFDRSLIGPLSPTGGQNVQTGYDLTLVSGS